MPEVIEPVGAVLHICSACAPQVKAEVAAAYARRKEGMWTMHGGKHYGCI